MNVADHEIDTWPHIEGKRLEPTDIGRPVRFTYYHGEQAEGLLSSFREDGSVFVRFRGPTGERCDARQLAWA